MDWGRATLATLLSLAAPAAAWLAGPEYAAEGASRVALALLPWIALAGLPAARAPHAGWLTAVALALPPIVLGAALDVRSGARPSTVALAASIGLACCGLLAYATGRAAAATSRAKSVHAAAWFALVAFAPVLSLAVELGGGPRATPGWLGVLARSGPLGWAASSVAALDLAPAWRALAVSSALALAFSRAHRAEPAP